MDACIKSFDNDEQWKRHLESDNNMYTRSFWNRVYSKNSNVHHPLYVTIHFDKFSHYYWNFEGFTLELSHSHNGSSFGWWSDSVDNSTSIDDFVTYFIHGLMIVNSIMKV